MNKGAKEHDSEKRVDDNLFLEALSHVAAPLDLEESLAIDPLEKEDLFRACQIIGGYSNIDFVTSQQIMLKGDGLIETLNAISAASNAGFRPVLLNGRWWEEASENMLAFYKETMKPVALIFEKDRYLMLDPETGEKAIIDESLACQFHPQAFVFYPVFSREENFPWKRAREILFAGSKRDVLYYILFFFASSTIGLLYPYLNKVFFDYVLPNVDTGLYLQVFFALLIASVAASLLFAASTAIKLRLTTWVSTHLQALVWSRVFELSPAFFRAMPVGEVLQRVMLIESFQAELNRNLIITFFSGIMSFLYLIPMFYYSWKLSCIVLLFTAAALVVFAALVPRLFNLNLRILKFSAILEGSLIQIVTGISNIRVFRAEKKAFAHWGRTFAKNQQASLELGSVSNALRVAAESLSMLLTFLIFGALLLIYQNDKGVILFSLGSFMAFRVAMGSYLGEFSQLVGAIIDSQSLFARWKRIKVVWEGKRKPDYKGASPDLKGNIEVSNLFYLYENETKPVLSDINLKINAGEFAAVAGPSGCGKSSLLRLLAGMEEPFSGSILYDHIPINDIDSLAFRGQVSAILQTTKVFSGTILDNILCGRKAKKEDIFDALKLSRFEEVLPQFPLGLSTPLPIGGLLLSNGQRQRLLLARALLSKPKILLLDEATSAIETETELSIINDLREKGMTLILVTHQPILLQNADAIFLMKDQTISVKGTYAEIFPQKSAEK